MYVLNRAAKHVKQNSIEIKGDVDKSTIVDGDLNISTIYKTEDMCM